MLSRLNRTCSRLWADESGVVLMMTVVVFLTLFILMCSIYAVGENIRQRIEIQNAADAAAYSAALVQADGISRMAVLNRALGWTHVQMSRAVRDYVLDVWLEDTLYTWNLRQQRLIAWCWAPDWHRIDYWLGQSPGRRNVIQLHNGGWKSLATVMSMHASLGMHWGQSAGLIDTYRARIIGLNAAEMSLVAGLQGHIQGAIRAVLQANTEPAPLDTQRDMLYTETSSPASAYLKLGASEYALMSYAGFMQPNAQVVIFEGMGDPNRPSAWLLLSESRGISRRYEQGSWLRARWNYNATRQLNHKPFTTQNLGQDYDEITGDDAISGWGMRDKKYSQTEPVNAYILSPDYFGKEGSIVVGVAKRMSNPYTFMAPGASRGIFSMFDVPGESNGRGRYQWAVAAARAGYWDAWANAGGSPRPHAENAGAYNPTLDSFEIGYEQSSTEMIAKGKWLGSIAWERGQPRQPGQPGEPGWSGRRYNANLMVIDWDAVLLPLRRAWSARTPAWQPGRDSQAGVKQDYSPGAWIGAPTAGTILNHLWTQAPWQRLYGGQTETGLRAVAVDTLPDGSSGLTTTALGNEAYH